MSDLNSVVLVGRLTRDAELKYTTGGTAIGRFSLAVDRRVKKDDGWGSEASFFDVSLFGKTAETLQKYLLKGKQVAIQGELRQNRWEKDGEKHSRVEIAANSVQLLGGGQGKSEAPREAPQETAGVDFNDDLPF